MGNITGNATSVDAEQAVMNATLIAIAVIGLAMPFIRIGWNRFRKIDGETLSSLAKLVVLSTAAVMTIAFIFSLLIGNTPGPDSEFDVSYFSFLIIMMVAWAALGGLLFYGYNLYRIWQHLMKRSTKKWSSIDIKELEEKGPSLGMWCSGCGTLVVSIACALLALLFLGMAALGLKFSEPTIQTGVWFSWSAVLVFVLGVVILGGGYWLDAFDIWPFRKQHKKEENKEKLKKASKDEK